MMNCALQNHGVILLVEDNEKLCEGNRRALEGEGYEVLTAFTLGQAREQLARVEPDVILLDVMLPDGSGFDFCREIRRRVSSHILFLTAKTEHRDTVRGLTGGGDDYIPKPFRLDELLARVRAVMRRRQSVAPVTELTKEPLSLDLIAARAYLNGADLKLTGTEFALLLLLAQNEGKILSAEYIYEKVWKMSLSGDKNAVQTAVSKLRKKLSGSGWDVLSERGKGYMFKPV